MSEIDVIDLDWTLQVIRYKRTLSLTELDWLCVRLKLPLETPREEIIKKLWQERDSDSVQEILHRLSSDSYAVEADGATLLECAVRQESTE